MLGSTQNVDPELGNAGQVDSIINTAGLNGWIEIG